MRFHTSVLLGLLAANVSIAAKVGKFDAEKCADPSGMKTCYDKAKSTYNECVKSKCDKDDNGKTTSDEECLNQCGCVRDRAQIDCAASSCWNQVCIPSCPMLGCLPLTTVPTGLQLRVPINRQCPDRILQEAGPG